MSHAADADARCQSQKTPAGAESPLWTIDLTKLKEGRLEGAERAERTESPALKERTNFGVGQAAYPRVECDAYVVMPNHFHGIVVFTDIVGANHESPLQSPQSLPGARRGMGLAKLLGRFKMRSAKRINLLRGAPGAPVWQRNYYERIIRDEAEWGRIREYIEPNPARWAEDRENPQGKTGKDQTATCEAGRNARPLSNGRASAAPGCQRR